MELTFIQQSTAFLYSIVLGIILGVLYGIIKLLRTAIDFGRVTTFLIDFVYMLVCSMSLFLLSVAYLQGYIRIHTYFGGLVGFLAYRLTVGKLFSKLYSPIIKVFKKLSRNISLKFKKIAKKLLKNTYKIMYNKLNKRTIFRNKLSSKAKCKRVVDCNEEEKTSARER